MEPEQHSFKQQGICHLIFSIGNCNLATFLREALVETITQQQEE
jgi:hypothetical protein